MQAGNVGRKQRQADGRPAQRVAGQKIAARLAALAFAQADPHARADDAGEVKHDNDEVNGADVFHFELVG